MEDCRKANSRYLWGREISRGPEEDGWEEETKEKSQLTSELFLGPTETQN